MKAIVGILTLVGIIFVGMAGIMAAQEAPMKAIDMFVVGIAILAVGAGFRT